jgi:hypothetical protein
MDLRPIRIVDIQTTDIIYYDEEYKDQCSIFCKERDIDCLPGLNDPYSYYTKISHSTEFQRNQISDENKIDGQTHLFDLLMEEKFKASSVLFVTTNDYLSGVVHFSDYNHPLVNTYLFNLISSYERSLRKLLVLKGLTYQDMVHFKNNSSNNKNGKKLKKGEPFEDTFLRDLLAFVNSQNIADVNVYETNQLRNTIMHAKKQVGLLDPDRGDNIYNQKSFTEFFNRVTILLKDYKKVLNKIKLEKLSTKYPIEDKE